jgi:predicted dithiol-disulfide oxidoreductase (DUF899 family)
MDDSPHTPGSLQHLKFPNENGAYRKARNSLLEAERELRRQVERVAAQRRALPPGGELSQDYVFERTGADGMPENVKLWHNDAIDPLWNLLDTVPEGRGDFEPALSYRE